MSIFKDTLKDFVAGQLKARQTVVSTEGFRDDTFLRYTTGKNAWVRMTSFVDYNNSSDLAKKYILEGGTLYPIGKGNEFGLRQGVGSKSSTYVSDIDLTYGSKTADRPLGIKPMPGISGVEVTSKSAYGSLREATIKFYAWDKHQLEELELLYMRTGYTVLLEWGWSQYLKHTVANASGINNIDIGTPLIENFNTPTINCFTTGLTDDSIYNQIEELNKKTLGNYDGMLGYIKNFSWQLMSNGGYECSTILISRGEVITSLKLSTNSNIALGSNKDNPPLSQFEKTLLSIKAQINNSEFYTINNGVSKIKGEFTEKPPPPDSSAKSSPAILVKPDADSIYDNLKTVMKNTSFIAADNGSTYAGAPDSWFEPIGTLRPCEGGNDGTAIEYINMSKFIHILNCLFGLKDGKTNKFVTQVEIPFTTPCLASEDSVSIDPETCLISNTKATFITDNTDGFKPGMYTYWDGATNVLAADDKVVFLGDFLDSNNRGQIGMIYLSINKLLEIYRSMGSNNKDGVLLVDYLQKVLDSVSFALGGINNFKLFNNKNTVKIIDVAYLEKGIKYGDKYEFDLLGLKSICRDVKISSKIFESQSTMIAIGAQSRANVGDVYSSTQNYLNEGLTDRVIKDKLVGLAPTETIPGEAKANYYKNIYANVANLSTYLNKKVLGDKLTKNDGSISYFKFTVVPESNEVSNASSLLKTIQYQLNGKDVNFKALIPFELEITLDGLSGFVIGQIFTINQSILPKSYSTQKVGFIITGLSQSLQNNDWTTRIKTQVCLLDPTYPDDVDKSKLKTIIEELKVISNKNTTIWCALADYMVYATEETFKVHDKDNPANIAEEIKGENIGDSGYASIDDDTVLKHVYPNLFPLSFVDFYKTRWKPTLKLNGIPDDVFTDPVDGFRTIAAIDPVTGNNITIPFPIGDVGEMVYAVDGGKFLKGKSFLTRKSGDVGFVPGIFNNGKYNIPYSTNDKGNNVFTSGDYYKMFDAYLAAIKETFKNVDPLFNPNNSNLLLSIWMDPANYKY